MEALGTKLEPFRFVAQKRRARQVRHARHCVKHDYFCSCSAGAVVTAATRCGAGGCNVGASGIAGRAGGAGGVGGLSAWRCSRILFMRSMRSQLMFFSRGWPYSSG